MTHSRHLPQFSDVVVKVSYIAGRVHSAAFFSFVSVHNSLASALLRRHQLFPSFISIADAQSSLIDDWRAIQQTNVVAADGILMTPAIPPGTFLQSQAWSREQVFAERTQASRGVHQAQSWRRSAKIRHLDRPEESRITSKEKISAIHAQLRYGGSTSPKAMPKRIRRRSSRLMALPTEASYKCQRPAAALANALRTTRSTFIVSVIL